ncbi:MAG: hypothetical protein AAGG01_11625, partial [Planctomycetota bacterium]
MVSPLAAVPQSPGWTVEPPSGRSFVSLVEPADGTGIDSIELALRADVDGGGFETHIYSVGADGFPLPTAQFDDAEIPGEPICYDTGRLITRSTLSGVWLYWGLNSSRAGLLRVGIPFAGGAVLDLEGETLVLGHPDRLEFMQVDGPTVVYPASTLGLPSRAEPIDVELDGNRLMVHLRFSDPSGIWTEVHVAERSVAGAAEWDDLQPLTAPPGTQWRDAEWLVDVGSGALVLAQQGDQQRTGRAFVYGAGPTGPYRYGYELQTQNEPRITDVSYSGFAHSVSIDGENVLVGSSFGDTAERYLGFANFAVFAGRHATAPKAQAGGRHAFAIVDGGLRVLAESEAPVDYGSVCSAAASFEGPDGDWELSADFSDLERSGTVAFGWAPRVEQVPGTVHLLLMSASTAHMPLGTGSVLCLGGPVRRLPMSYQAPFNPAFPALVTLRAEGVEAWAGTRLYFQAWRPEPGFSAGLTSNAVT